MRQLTVSSCLILLVFLGVVGKSFALPACPGSYGTNNWTNCFGTFTFGVNRGAKYVGEFKDNKRHGQGTATFANGAKYVGEFRDDKFQGQGTYTYPNGDKYVGEFRDDKFHGQGTYTYADGRVEESMWENDEFLKPWWKLWF